MYILPPTFAGASDRQNVRLQETGEETDKEAQRGGDGADWETDIAADQLSLRGEPGVRLRDEGRSLSGANYNER